MNYKFHVRATCSSIRIIGGKWKGRKILITPYAKIRPTTNLMRETLFNWLYSVISDAVCLDCFAGSGALGLEALSRGARKVTFLEYNHICVTVLLQTIRSLKAIYSSEVICTDSIFWLKKLNEDYNIVFIDPPFNKEYIIFELIFLLEKYNNFKKKSWIYIEMSKYRNILKSNICMPRNWVLYRKKITRNVEYYLYLRNM